MKVFRFVGRFFKFFYYWMLFFMTIELIYRPLVLKQKMYQLADWWIPIVVIINIALIGRYLRKLIFPKDGILEQNIT